MFLKKFLATPTALFYRRISHLRRTGFKPRLILDIGAYRGGWSQYMRKFFPASKFFLVEANEDHRAYLDKLTFANYAIALLGEKRKKRVDYYAVKQSGISTGNSIFKERTHSYDDVDIRKLPMVTLDYVVKKYRIQNIDFIKLDTQGSELNIIRGASATIDQSEFVLIETQNLEYNKNAPFIFEVFSVMENYGFALYDITELHYLPSGELFQVDLLFVKQTSKYLKTGVLC